MRERNIMATSFPKGRTAFVVIHGIGEQNPFETLDGFARGVIDHFERERVAWKAEHRLAARQGATGAGWTESYVRLRPKEGERWVDVHEYYWAYQTEEQITVTDIGHWLDQTIQGAKKYFRENEELQHRYEGGENQYVSELISVLRWVQWWYRLIRIGMALLPDLNWLSGIRDWLEGLTTPLIVGYIGDIAIYTTMDEKSRYYQMRQKILAESQALLEQILADPDYDRVIMAGHSLGSVIAYDTLNLLNLRANLGVPLPLQKFNDGGLITFGSPLDKIAFFFREHAERNQSLRRQIMAHLHSFKARPLTVQREPVTLANPIQPKLDAMPWANYYDEQDPVSGHLDFYAIPDRDNVPLTMGAPWGVAHVKYWEHPPMYDDIVRRYCPP
jgi:hypothetical protein